MSEAPKKGSTGQNTERTIYGRSGVFTQAPHEAVGAFRLIRKSLSCEPGESNERSAFFRMASNSAAAYGQIRYELASLAHNGVAVKRSGSGPLLYLVVAR